MRQEWQQAYPWLFAALISALIPPAILAVFSLYPNVRSFLHLGNNPIALFPFGMSQPLGNLASTLIVSVSVAYWVFGLASARRVLRKQYGQGSLPTLFFSTASVATLLFIIPMLAIIWSLALHGNHIPTGM